MEVMLKGHSEQAEALMDGVLRSGAAIAPEYPLVFEERFPGRVISLEQDGETCSSCAILAREFVIEDRKVKGGLIGSVVTRPESRGQGHATHMLIEAEAALQIEGCAFALLWAEQPDFYVQRGYGPMGCEYDFILPRALAHTLPEPSCVRAMKAEDAKAIHAIYEQHLSRVVRGAEETAALLECPEMTTLVRTLDEEVVAYACLGRGQDLGTAIHEWGGEAQDVLALIRAHLEQAYPVSAASEVGDPQHLFLMAPSTATDLYLRLESLGFASRRGMLGLGKILNRTATAELLDQLLGDRGSVEVLEDQERAFYLRGGGKECMLDDEGVLGLLFGVADVRQEVVSFLRIFGLEGVRLPLEPFVWGLDSI